MDGVSGVILHSVVPLGVVNFEQVIDSPAPIYEIFDEVVPGETYGKAREFVVSDSEIQELIAQENEKGKEPLW